jgi:hypothetical protein
MVNLKFVLFSSTVSCCSVNYCSFNSFTLQVCHNFKHVILLEEQHWNNLMTNQKPPKFYRFKFLNAIEIKQPLTFIFSKANRIFHDQEGPAATPVGTS